MKMVRIVLTMEIIMKFEIADSNNDALAATSFPADVDDLKSSSYNDNANGINNNSKNVNHDDKTITEVIVMMVMIIITMVVMIVVINLIVKKDSNNNGDETHDSKN